jgi:AraC-like DNA-binding protein
MKSSIERNSIHPIIGGISDESTMIIHVQNMVSRRCKMFVASTLIKLDINFFKIDLGEITLNANTPHDKLNKLKSILHESGLEIMSDKNSIIIESIIHIVIEMVHQSKELPKHKFSGYLSEKLNMDYTKLSTLFSKTKGMTIEHYIILNKIERVKELIMYEELSLSEIADLLHYSSVAHLSHQFKKITGLTPSFYKSLPRKNRINLEDI